MFRTGMTLWKYLFWVKPHPPTEYNMSKNYVYSIPRSCCRVIKGKTCHPLKVRLEEHRKAVCRGEVKKSVMANYLWKEKGNHLPLWDEVKIVDRGEYLKIRGLKEAAHMSGHNDRRLNKGFNSRLCVISRVLHEIHEEGQRTHRPKRCEYNDEMKIIIRMF